MAAFAIRAGWFGWEGSPWFVPIAPAWTTAPSVTGATITINYKENLTADASVLASQFACTVAGAARTISAVVATAGALTITLATPVTTGQVVELTYTPGADPVKDDDGTNVPGFGPSRVTNLT